MGKRPSEITKWLSGTYNFNTDTLFDIEDVLGIIIVAIEKAPAELVAKGVTIGTAENISISCLSVGFHKTSHY